MARKMNAYKKFVFPTGERRNTGAGLMPSSVVAAVVNHIRLEAEIGGYEAADARAAVITSTYAAVASMIGAAPQNIAVIGNATHGFIRNSCGTCEGSARCAKSSACPISSTRVRQPARSRLLPSRAQRMAR